MNERVGATRSITFMVMVGAAVLVSVLALAGVLSLIIEPSYAAALLVGVLISVVAWLIWSAYMAKRIFALRHSGAELTASKRREEVERERIITLMNNLADAVLSVDADGVITLFNAACLGLLDTNATLEGKKLNDVFKLSDDQRKPVRLFGHIKKAKSVTVDDTLRMKQGEETLRMEFTYAPIRGSFGSEQSGSEGYMIIARDITRLKSLEEERDEFISVVSHELRTPITVAEGTISNVQLMLERGMGDQKTLEKNLHEAHEQILYLARMINDLSTLSRAERGVADEIETIDVEAMAHELYTEYAPEAEKQGLRLDLKLGHDLGSVSTSRLYLHELLQNFITNGIKYTKEGSVTLRIDKDGGRVLFSVADTGIGISRSDQVKVFDKFFRSEDYRTRETGGTGLGLYVAAKLSRKIGTTIELKSRLNHGSVFSFELASA